MIATAGTTRNPDTTTNIITSSPVQPGSSRGGWQVPRQALVVRDAGRPDLSAATSTLRQAEPCFTSE